MMTPDMQRALRTLVDQIDLDETVRRRAVQEAITNALATTWTARAATLEAALPQHGDFPGGPVDWNTGQPLDPPPPRDDAVRDLQAAVLACRQKAALLERRWIDG